MASSWIDELNPAQRQAATHGEGPVLVIAGAGTGKTKTLASRVAWLIEQGASPDRILLLTFTRRAAAEMLRRAGRLIGGGQATRVWGGTFHATANRLLRHHGRAVGLAPDFTVIDQADAADAINLVRGDLGLGDRKRKRRFPRKTTLIAIYSRMVNSRVRLPDLLAKHYPWCAEEIDDIRRVFEQYTRRKREQNVLDYDDLLLHWLALCQADVAGREIADRFDHILVDEYQDTNLIQAETLKAMRRTKHNVMVVGDDAQSIYSFRAATVRNILDFPEQFAGAAVIKLERNYRSIQPILDAANEVMAGAKQRYTKQLYSDMPSEGRPAIVTCLDDAEQCDEVCDRVLARLEEGTPLREQAVLFRTGHHSDALEVELTRRNIPFVKFGGIRFVEAAHVKDLLAVLRVLENPADELSWYRLLQLLEGIGPITARRLIADLTTSPPPAPNPLKHEDEAQRNEDRARDQAGDRPGPPDPLQTLTANPPPVPPAARNDFNALRAALADCLEFGGAQPAAQVERLRRFYDPIFQRVYDNPTVRLRDLDQLEQIATGYRTRRAFLTDLTLDPPTQTQDLAGPPLLDEDYLILSTIHSAKGCEWDAVHIIHAADGMIPSDMATASDDEIEEERRLLYVAMTRARRSLTLYFPLRYYFRRHHRAERHSYAQLTRFIPESSYPHYERITAGKARDLIGDADGGPVGPATGGASAAQTIDTMLSDLMGTE